MAKKVQYTVLFGILAIILWIYRSSILETNDAIIFITQHNDYIRNTINRPVDVCKNTPLIIVIVTSYAGHVELRSAHRRAMSQDYLQSLNVTRIFLLAKIPSTERYITQEAIDNENQLFGDILQGAFVENYRNLTYKHLMGLLFASTECEKAPFILKVDDDTVFNLKGTLEFLTKIPVHERENLIIGYVLNNTTPRRNKENKWFVTWEEYPRSQYPPYLSGWYYIVSTKIAKEICDEAIYYPFFWIDDILITGLIAEVLDLKLKQLPDNYWLEYYELLECCLKDMITESIKCEHIVGPNGGRNNLIYEFNIALAKCDKLKNCTTRSADSSLKQTCVVYRERPIFSDGMGEVHHIRL